MQSFTSKMVSHVFPEDSGKWTFVIYTDLFYDAIRVTDFISKDAAERVIQTVRRELTYSVDLSGEGAIWQFALRDASGKLIERASRIFATQHDAILAAKESARAMGATQILRLAVEGLLAPSVSLISLR